MPRIGETNLLCYGDNLQFLSDAGPMRQEAAAAGLYTSPWNRTTYPKVQILTVDQLLADPHKPDPRCLLVPRGLDAATLSEVERHKGKGERQKGLGFE